MGRYPLRSAGDDRELQLAREQLHAVNDTCNKGTCAVDHAAGVHGVGVVDEEVTVVYGLWSGARCRLRNLRAL